MDDFNDYYNRFVASTYGRNVLNYLFFISAFFVFILTAVILILLNDRKSPHVSKQRDGYLQPTEYKQ